jgi:hypothetical protein
MQIKQSRIMTPQLYRGAIFPNDCQFFISEQIHGTTTTSEVWPDEHNNNLFSVRQNTLLFAHTHHGRSTWGRFDV